MSVIIDRLVRSARRTVGLTITREGDLVVRAPRRLAEAEIRRIVESKAAWIRRTQGRLRERAAGRPRHRYEQGESFMLLGESHPLEIVEGLKPRLAYDGVFRLTAGGAARGRALFEAWYRRRAAEVFAERAARWGAAMGAAPSRIVVSGARTKWGSCDARGTVRLAWRLVMAPPEIVDYVVVHELAHLEVRGHRRPFWDFVEAHLPDWRDRRRWLADRGHTLDL
jgi:predicted metal-dependent hydrolase